MKRFVGIALGGMFLSLSASAASLPVYLGEVKGVALSSLTTGDDFEFHPGTIGACTLNDAGTIQSYTCDVTGAQAVVRGNGKTISVSFTQVIAQYVTPNLSPQYRRFIYNGEWTERTEKATFNSKVRVELWHYNTSPQDIRGSFALSNYGVAESIQASQPRR